MQNVIMRPLTKCSTDQKKAVRDIRNQESVRKAMYSDHKISLKEHLAWVDRLEVDEQQIVFVVLLEGKVSGAVSINALDRFHKRSDCTFYLAQIARGGLGTALEFNLINFAFTDLKLEKLNCEVIENNSIGLNMHKKFSFVEEGFRRSNIKKEGVRLGVHFLGLTRGDWLISCDKIYQKYRLVLEKFSITLEKP